VCPRSTDIARVHDAAPGASSRMCEIEEAQAAARAGGRAEGRAARRLPWRRDDLGHTTGYKQRAGPVAVVREKTLPGAAG